jgi:CHAD domain-containing protein
MAADHLEVEDKYHLDDDTVLPDFGAMPGVKSVSTADHELVATYFDTSELALARAGVTLRRRTGGEDAGWHLKLPMTEARLEITLPLGRALRNPPASLRKVVAGIVRDDVVAPVVTIRTDRRVHRLHGKKGVTLAEVVDDRVSAEPVTSDAPGLAPIVWREAEVELVTGRPSLLVWASDLMTSVGARRSESPSKLVQALGDRLPPPGATAAPEPGRKSRAADVIQLRLLTQVAALRQQDPWARHGAPEAVHDLRVTVRRLRHALASYRPFLDQEHIEPVRDDLGWLAGLLGGPRDAEVLHHLLRGLVDDEPSSLVRGPVRARIDRAFRERFATARADLLAAMESARYLDLVDRLQALADDPPWTEAAEKKAGRTLAKSLDDDWKRLRARVLQAADEGSRLPGTPVDLHDVRKAAKRVRYAAEALVPLPGKGAKRMVKAHERIQTVLGDQHDDIVAQAALVELADAASAAGESAFTYGLLHGRLHARSVGHAADFDQAWQDSLTARARLLKR